MSSSILGRVAHRVLDRILGCEVTVSPFVPQGLGWQPDLPDARDYTFRHPEVLSLLRRLAPAPRKTLPDAVDLRSDGEGEYFSPPGDQGSMNSSSAFAVLSLVEYFERRIHGRAFDGSKRFLYKVTRNRIAKSVDKTADNGADIRTTLKVLTQFGVPPEEYFPYDVQRSHEEPNAFVYGLAKPFPELRYFRLDEPNSNGEATWATLKSFLAAGFPIAFGFTVPSTLTSDASIPYRPDFDIPRGGQAAVAVGYKINKFGRGLDGMLLRSSWGSQWGDNGNGWLPVSFIRKQIAKDFWGIVRDYSFPSSELSLPSVIPSPRDKLRNSRNTQS